MKIRKIDLLTTILILIIASMLHNLAILVFSLILLAILNFITKDLSNKEYNYFTIGLIINLIFILILYFGYLKEYGSPYYLGGSDDKFFEIYASNMNERGMKLPSDILKVPEYMYQNGLGYIWLVGIVMKVSEFLGGYVTIIPRILNAFLTIYICVMVYKYLKRRYDISKIYKIVILVVTTFPNNMYVSSHVFRDTIVAFLTVCIFYIMSELWGKSKKKNLVLIFVVLIIFYVGYWVRETSIVYFCLIIVSIKYIKRISIKNFILIIFLLVGAFYLFGIDKVLINYNTSYNKYMMTVSDGLSSTIFSTPLIPFGIVLRIFYGLMYPFPGGIINMPGMFDNIDKFMAVVTSIGTIVQILLIPYLVKGIKRVDDISIIFLGMFFSIILTTFGFRHFVVLYPFMWILIFRELVKEKFNLFKLKSSIIMYFGVILGLIYVLLKG